IRAGLRRDKPDAREEVPVVLNIYLGRDRVKRVPIGKRVHPDNWDEAARQVKGKSGNAALINSLIVSKTNEVLTTLVQSKIANDGKQVDAKKVLASKEKTGEHDFYLFAGKIMELCTSGGVLTPEGRKYTEGSIKNFGTAREKLREFLPTMTFENITLDTYRAFIVHCNLKGWSANYTGRIVKDWKRLMNIGNALHWHFNLIHKHADFKKTKEDSFQVALSEEEIKAILNVDLSGDRMREAIRDRYVISLYSGFRISDMKQLKESHFGKLGITQVNQKTKQRVVVPVHPIIKEILKKYKGELPRQYNDILVNREIKLIAKKAGINELIRFAKTIGGVRKEFVKKKYELITTHTARRSMATNLLEHVDLIDAMQVLGMSARTLQKYNKRTPERNAELLKDNPFFNDKKKAG
ncbi:MAG TPA: tyrosine-type recombinase/integrase, partial [Flavisolibacter sp.]|nr:tyrosine-type recombinase/integrase [Flavisolibacter sp.]